MKISGLLPGDDLHHLDHLAPLCSLLNIPLVVTSSEIAELASRYYPDLQLLCFPLFEMPFAVLKDYDCAITCLPRALIDEFFFAAQLLLNKRIRTFWCPHGNSDKGWTIPFMEALKSEETLLVYGSRMRNFLKAKEVFVPTISVGNYRLEYYHRHKAFYDSLFPPLDKTTLLYAPTWQDREFSSSFESFYPYLLKELPADFHLVLKPHPHLYQQYPQLLEEFKPHLIESAPPIYPLLNRTALYIGDMSSIGYDFLAFARPLLLLNPNCRDPHTDPGLYLAQCGPLLAPKDYSSLYSYVRSLLEHNQWEQKQKEIYFETFDLCKIALQPEFLNCV